MNANRSKSSSRRISFRLAAILLGLMPFILLEVLVRLAGWGLPRESYDPYLGFESIRPLFVLNDQEDRYQVVEGRLDFFCQDSFPVNKSDKTYRIFCLGGSTVQGRPYATETAFSSWLELSLQSAAPQRDWEVINCGGISYASYRLVPILEEVSHYQPDLIILYSGHNEFLEDRTYPRFRNPSLATRLFHRIRASWQTVNCCRQLWHRQQPPETSTASRIIMPTEVNGLLDQARLQDYHHDPQWHRDVIQHYQFNLQQMIEMTRQANIPLILVNPVSNLKDCPPFKIEPGKQVVEADRRRVQELFNEAQQSLTPAARMEKLQAAAALDPEHAGIQYELGKGYEAMGQFDKAKTAFIHAKEQDVCPLRMLESMHEILRNTARQYRIPLVDARQELANRSPQQIPGDEVLVDHVHPKIESHQWIADALLEKMFELKILSAREGWEKIRSRRYREHSSQLSAAYYVRGNQRLEGLRLWTQGRARQLNVESPPPATNSPTP